MSTQIVPYASLVDLPEDRKPLETAKILNKYLFHWPLFALSIAIALTAAFIYLRFSDDVYDVKSKILIRDEKKGEEDEPALKELDLFKDKKVVENEVEILQSRKLMQQVVHNLDLAVDYYREGMQPNKDLYGNSPVKLQFIKPAILSDKGQVFYITIKNTARYSIQNEGGKNIEAPFGRSMQNSAGIWKIERAPNFKDYIGRKIKVVVNNPDLVTDDYLSKLKVEPSNKLTSVIEIGIKDNVPQRGKDILNELIRHYSLLSLEKKNKITERTLSFIDGRLASLAGELSEVEKNVEGYRSSRGLTDISSESQVFLQNVQSNDKLLNEANVQLNILGEVEQYINSSQYSGNAPATIGINEPTLVNLINKLTELQLQREKLLAITPEGNPVFKPLNRQISITKASIRENINGIKNSLLATRNKLHTFNAGFENSIKKIPGQERQLLDIKRQQNIKENLYVYLLQKREEVALSYASTIAESQTVDQAYAGIPVWPKKKFVYITAFLLGIVLPAGLIYGRDRLNNRVSSRSEIEATTSVPIINEVMFEQGKSSIVVSDKDTYAIGEQFRALRTNLHYLHSKKENGRVTLLTSSIPNEGKSFVTNNLGMALASAGRKTIILELDLRKPQILKNLNIPAGTAGLSNYLKGQAAKEDIIQPSGIHDNLDIIGAGPLPSNPSELLEQTDIFGLIEWLKAEYDDILIDSPPLHLVTDAMILARVCDVTLYIVRHNYTNKSELQFVEQLNKENKLPGLNVVFNGVYMDKRYGYSLDYQYYMEGAKSSASKDLKTFFSRRF